MPQVIQNDAGEDVEVFTKEELDAQAETAKAEAVAAKDAELQTAQEELAKLKEKDLNFGNLRDQKDKAEQRVEALKAEVDTKIAAAEERITKGVLKDHYDGTVAALAGNDEELRKKVEFHYGRIADVATDKAGMDKKLRDAYVLATASPEPDALTTTVLSSGGVGRVQAPAGAQRLSAEEQAVGQKFGLSVEDMAKYGTN